MGKIIFLGTTCMKPTKERNHSGVLLQSGKEQILFDCGEGIQRQMKIAGLKLSKITRICITHWHGDHSFGLPGLLSTMGADEISHAVHIYGPKGTKKHIEFMFKAFASIGVTEYVVHEVQEGIIYQNDEFILMAELLNHGMPCVGFSFIQKDRNRIDVKKAKKLGLEGPILGELQQGNDIKFKGENIKFEDVTYPVKGKKISYIVDTMPCQGAEDLAKNADIAIIESTFHSDEKENARKFYHMTSLDAGKLAQECNVSKLILTHPSTRYKTVTHLIEEAQQYHDDITFAEDFMTFQF
jgi:ribonuclease Z